MRGAIWRLGLDAMQVELCRDPVNPAPQEKGTAKPWGGEVPAGLPAAERDELHFGQCFATVHQLPDKPHITLHHVDVRG